MTATTASTRTPSQVPQGAIETMIMRGGTSKGLFVRAADLPAPGAERDALVLSLLGAGDELQVDGLGGGNPSTSKLIAVSSTCAPDAELEYLYAAVTPGRERVEYSGNCGNLTAAVAMYALLMGEIKSDADTAVVTLLNLNTQTRIRVRQPMRGGRPVVDGDYRMDGVARLGAEIVTSYLDPGGSMLGSLLPTGRAVDEIEAGALGRIPVSFVDVTSAYQFVPAAFFGLDGSETPMELNTRPDLLTGLEAVRAQGAVALGLVERVEDAAVVSAGVPRLALVAPPRQTDEEANGAQVEARAFSGGRIHHAISVTGSMCLAAAALLPGTVVADVADDPRAGTPVRIGHPKGVAEARVELSLGEGSPEVRSTSVSRTARPLMSGWAYR